MRSAVMLLGAVLVVTAVLVGVLMMLGMPWSIGQGLRAFVIATIAVTAGRGIAARRAARNQS